MCCSANVIDDFKSEFQNLRSFWLTVLALHGMSLWLTLEFGLLVPFLLPRGASTRAIESRCELWDIVSCCRLISFSLLMLIDKLGDLGSVKLFSLGFNVIGLQCFMGLERKLRWFLIFWISSACFLEQFQEQDQIHIRNETAFI